MHTVLRRPWSCLPVLAHPVVEGDALKGALRALGDHGPEGAPHLVPDGARNPQVQHGLRSSLRTQSERPEGGRTHLRGLDGARSGEDTTQLGTEGVGSFRPDDVAARDAGAQAGRVAHEDEHLRDHKVEGEVHVPRARDEIETAHHEGEEALRHVLPGYERLDQLRHHERGAVAEEVLAQTLVCLRAKSAGDRVPRGPPVEVDLQRGERLEGTREATRNLPCAANLSPDLAEVAREEQYLTIRLTLIARVKHHGLCPHHAGDTPTPLWIGSTCHAKNPSAQDRLGVEVNRLQVRRLLAPASTLLVTALLLAGCGAAGRPNTGAGTGTTTGNAGTTTGTGNMAKQAKTSAHKVKSTGNKAAHKITSKANKATTASKKPSKGKVAKGSKKAASAMAPVSITPAMAVQGASLFRSTGCTSCHGPQGQGTSAAPALNGTGPVPILSTYPTPAALATFIHVNMPLTNPGKLTATQADELAAYVFYTLNHGKATGASTTHGG